MTKIKVSPDCGNSPKLTFVKDFLVAFAEKDFGTILERITDDVTWEFVGDRTLRGREDFVNELEKLADFKLTEVEIHRVVTHGKEGAANGTLTDEDGNKYAFAEFYEFNSAKVSRVKNMSTYLLKLENGG